MTIELPCKLGDEVWALKRCNHGYIPYQTIVSQMYFCDDMRLCIVAKNIARGEWGKVVFATKAEALAEMERRMSNEKATTQAHR